MSATGAATVGGVIDTSLDISEMLWWMAGLILVPGVLWTLWITLGKATRVAAEISGDCKREQEPKP